MKKFIISTLSLVALSSAYAREPKATLCEETAVKAATSLYLINEGQATLVNPKLELQSMNHEEGGYEVWDVLFYSKDGQTPLTTPYRVHVVVDDCTVTKVEMVGAG